MAGKSKSSRVCLWDYQVLTLLQSGPQGDWGGMSQAVMYTADVMAD